MELQALCPNVYSCSNHHFHQLQIVRHPRVNLLWQVRVEPEKFDIQESTALSATISQCLRFTNLKWKEGGVKCINTCTVKPLSNGHCGTNINSSGLSPIEMRQLEITKSRGDKNWGFSFVHCGEVFNTVSLYWRVVFERFHCIYTYKKKKKKKSLLHYSAF